MSCCNSRRECDEREKNANQCHDSYKKTECFECECHKKNICDYNKPKVMPCQNQNQEY